MNNEHSLSYSQIGAKFNHSFKIYSRLPKLWALSWLLLISLDPDKRHEKGQFRAKTEEVFVTNKSA